MASSLISNQIYPFQFRSIFLRYPKTQSFVKSPIRSSSSAEASHLNLYLKCRISRASSEVIWSSGLPRTELGCHRIAEYWIILLPMLYTNLPTELTEDSKFVPLNSEDPNCGPPALLLLGFQVEEAAKIQQLLKELDGEFLEIIFCTEDMINRSLWEAVNTKQANLDAMKVAKSVPRICFLSGLTGEEMMMFIDAFPESGLEPPVFAALVPNSADKPLSELIEEIIGDHEMLSARKTS